VKTDGTSRTLSLLSLLDSHHVRITLKRCDKGNKGPCQHSELTGCRGTWTGGRRKDLGCFDGRRKLSPCAVTLALYQMSSGALACSFRSLICSVSHPVSLPFAPARVRHIIIRHGYEGHHHPRFRVQLRNRFILRTSCDGSQFRWNPARHCSPWYLRTDRNQQRADLC
jgi:hypothetical protein